MKLIATTDTLAYGLTEAYHMALMLMHRYGRLRDCPDWGTECLEASLIMTVNHPLAEPRISKLGIHTPESLQQYVREMVCGIMDFEVERGNWEYTYHQRMQNQIEAVIQELKRNPYSRRAVIRVAEPNDILMNDPPCLQLIQYQLRDNCLDCTVYFRSNDLWEATFMNAFALIEIQQLIASELNVLVGTYRHIAENAHIYKKDFEAFKSFVNKYSNLAITDPIGYELFVEKSILHNDTAYYFDPLNEDTDDWSTMMVDANASIDAKIARLKGE